MTPLARATEIAFIIIWFLAVGTWFYGLRYWFRFQRASRAGEPTWPHLRSAFKNMGLFVGLVLLGFLAGAIGQYWGGGWK